jgi:hypothetical protein
VPDPFVSFMTNKYVYTKPKTVIHTSCSNFLLLTGGCSCSTQSARTFSVDLTASRAVVNGLRSSGFLDVDIPCRHVSTLSDHDICDASTINWACNETSKLFIRNHLYTTVSGMLKIKRLESQII